MRYYSLHCCSVGAKYLSIKTKQKQNKNKKNKKDRNAGFENKINIFLTQILHTWHMILWKATRAQGEAIKYMFVRRLR